MRNARFPTGSGKYSITVRDHHDAESARMLHAREVQHMPFIA
jgi:hypothetical protein